MGYKCTPQLIGLVRGTPKGKHRANGGKICREFGDGRFSNSDTLDRTRSHLNAYAGRSESGNVYHTGQDCWDDLKAKAEAYRIKGKAKDGSETSRGLRKDAVIGYAGIFNPPDEMCVGWDRATYNKFYTDSFDVLGEIEPRLFRRQNIKMITKHRDEGLPDENGNYGEHAHFAGIPLDENGRYCGNLLDAKLLSAINREYPRKMRERGWELDDLDTTDWERYKADAEYREERKAKRKNSGKSVNEYIADKADKADETLAEANDYYASVKALQTELSGEVAKARKLAKDCQNLKSGLIRQAQEADEPGSTYEAYLDEPITVDGQTTTRRADYDRWRRSHGKEAKLKRGWTDTDMCLMEATSLLSYDPKLEDEVEY